MKDKLEFFIGALDGYLAQGADPDEALRQAVADYAFVYHLNDGRSLIARAAERTLRRLEGELVTNAI